MFLFCDCQVPATRPEYRFLKILELVPRNRLIAVTIVDYVRVRKFVQEVDQVRFAGIGNFSQSRCKYSSLGKWYNNRREYANYDG